MDAYLPYLVSGVTLGSVYGLTAVGLVLTYRTSGVFNFAHGAVAAVGAFAFASLHDSHGVPWPLAMALCVFVLAPLIGLVLELVANGVTTGGTNQRITATVGLQVGITALLIAIYGPASRDLGVFLPTRTFLIGGVRVGGDQLVIVAVATVSTVGLYAFLRLARVGIWMRAVVDDAPLLGLTGTSAYVVRASAWVLGTAFAALSGILLAETSSLDAGLLSVFIVAAFGAAAIGLFRSLPLTYVGGLLIGVLVAMSTKLTAGHVSVAKLPTSLPFLVLFVVLLVVPRRKLIEPGARRHVSPKEFSLPRNARLAVTGVGVALLLLAPNIVGTKLPVYTSGLIYLIVFQSLNLLVRISGQTSLCHAAFVAVGAAAFSHFGAGLHLPWLVAFALAGLVAVPVGAIVAIPAIRLSSLYLALATFGFGLLMQDVFYSQSYMFGSLGGIEAPRPSMLDTDTRFYYLCAVIAVGVGLLVAAINRSRLGRLLRAMGESPLTLSTLGLTVNATRFGVFCISAFLAALAGALFASAGGTTGGSSTYTVAFASLTWLATLGMSGPLRQYAPVLAAAATAVIPAYITSATFNDYLPVLFGIGAVAAAISESRPRTSGERATSARSRGPVRGRLEHSPVRARLQPVRYARVPSPSTTEPA